jgi:hypothetical protein
VLPVGHFHVVFTLPSELRPLTRAFPQLLFDATFRAASETLLELGQTRLGGLLGVTMVLHTWTRDLRFHPHVHAIVSAGVFDSAGAWKTTSIKYLFPVEVMAEIFRGKMLDFLRRMHARGLLQRHDTFQDPEAFERLTARLAYKRWCVYAKRPFRRAEHLLGYLGRYTHRVAIANSRLVDVRADAVTFRTKNGKAETLHPVDFLRRFVEHVLPPGFKKIRHFGLYATSHRDALETARCQISARTPHLVFPGPTPCPPLETASRKRIPCEQAWLIEVKRRLNRGAIGQVIVGADLFGQQHKVAPARLIIVCERRDDALAWVCERRSIEVFSFDLETTGG